MSPCSFGMGGTILGELRYAARSLRRTPAFTAAAVATLALGIAVNTLVFTLLDAIVWRPLPVQDPKTLVRIFPLAVDGRAQNLLPLPLVREFARAESGLAGVAAYLPFEVTSAEADNVRPVLAYAVSSSYFPLLGIELSRGRTFVPAEDTDRGSARVAIISHARWLREFDGADDVVGRRVILNGLPFTIVGVGPLTFKGTEPLEPELWVPLTARALLEHDASVADDSRTRLLALGRLAPGVSRDAVADRLSRIAQPSVAPIGEVRIRSVQVVPATFFHAGTELRPVILLVMTTVALVLMIACANVANLMLARATARRRELAVRRALGAGTTQLAWHLAAESLVLSLLGGGAGLLVSAWTLRVLYPVALGLLPFGWAKVVLDVSPSGRVFVYTLAVSIVAAALFGLWPLVEIRLTTVANGLRGDGGVFGRHCRGQRLRQAFIITQVAMCLMLLAAAAVAARALQRTESLDVGIDPTGVVHTSADLRRHGYSDAEAAAFHRRLMDRAAAIPGVIEVALTSHVPLTGGVMRVLATPEGSGRGMSVTYTLASPAYFRALGLPIVAGRTFTEAEASAEAPVAVVSEALARRLWPGQHALGKRLAIAGRPTPASVVGVVRDASNAAIWLEKEISVYAPATTTTAPNLRLLVKTSGNPVTVASILRREVRALDPRLRFDAAPIREVLAMWILPSRVAAAVAAVLGTLGLTLAGMGVYGLMSFTVAQRRREIGIRIALGASRRDVATLLLSDGARLVMTGLAIGMIAAVAMVRAVGAVLPGAPSADALALASASLVLAVAALGACYFPARSASRTDPLLALRCN